MYADAMTLDEQIGQVLIAGFQGTRASPEIIDLIERHHLGGVVLFSRNIESAAQVYELISSLQACARAAGHRSPLLVAIDQENGMVQRLGEEVTLFPGNMALGATDSEHLVTSVARATGLELRSLGINLNLAPVLDVNNNPANPVIGVRSFGEDPWQVARLGIAALQGYREAGIICCLKHFPGHGDTATDSHLALPLIPYGLERLEHLELLPFQQAIAAGAKCVMTAHVAFPALTGDATQPATVAPSIISGLLRQRLGFAGVVISDCLEMEAIAATLGVELGAIMALQAGCNLLLISHEYPRQRAGLQALRTAVEEGRLARTTLQEAAERVAALKAAHLSWEQLPSATALAAVKNAHHLSLQREAYEQTTTLVRNAAGLLPLRLEDDQRLLIVLPQKRVFSRVEDQQYPEEALLEAVRRRHANVEAWALTLPLGDEERARLLRASNAAAVLLLVSVNAHQEREQSELVNWLLRESATPVVGLAVYSPYDLLAFPRLSSYLVTYEYTRPAIESAVSVLFGEREPRGHLPVSLPGLHVRGEGLSY